MVAVGRVHFPADCFTVSSCYFNTTRGEPEMTNNKNVLNWIEEMKALVKPDKVVWIDGSEEQLKELRDLSISIGDACCTALRSTMSRVLKAEPISAPETKRMQARPTTGKTRRSCMKSSKSCMTAVCRAAPCMSSPTAWVRSVPRSPKSALS